MIAASIGRLTVKVRRLGLRVGSCLAVLYIDQTNRANSCRGYAMKQHYKHKHCPRIIVDPPDTHWLLTFVRPSSVRCPVDSVSV